MSNSGEPILQITGLVKRFGSNTVLHGVDLTVAPGEFIGLIGPNGAGKSTIIKVLAGVYTADGGEVRFNGRVVTNLSKIAGVGFIHQDLGLIDSLTVLENLRLGVPPLRRFGPFLDLDKERAEAGLALDRVRLDVDLDALVGTLAPGEKALLAVARLLSLGARFIVVDEATSTLPPGDSRRLIHTLRDATDHGAAVLLVSHKLSEVLEVARRAVVVIDGEIAADEPVDQTDPDHLVRLLMAHEGRPAELASTPFEPGETLVRFRQVTAAGIGPVDLDLRRSQAVGLTGLSGSGLHAIGLLGAGVLAPTAGSVEMSPTTRRALVPPQREVHGTIPELPVLWNMTLSSVPRWRRWWRMLDLRDEELQSQEMMERLQVVPRDLFVRQQDLSGGNQQKVIFGRALLQRPDVFVLCEPTRGVDVRTRLEIYRLIIELKQQGAAVLIVSSDAEDLFAVCDVVGVVENGRITHLWDGDELDTDALAQLL